MKFNNLLLALALISVSVLPVNAFAEETEKEGNKKQEKKEAGVTSKLTLPKSFVLKYIFEDGGWFVLRPSGTEPKLKIYIAIKEASEEASKALIEQVKKEVLAIIDTVE